MPEWLRRLRDDRGMLSVEYVLILAVVVLPLVLLEPLWMDMIQTYCFRVVRVIGLPFP